MSNFAKKVLNWYLSGVWTQEMVQNVYLKGRLTEEEYQTIIDSKP